MRAKSIGLNSCIRWYLYVEGSFQDTEKFCLSKSILDLPLDMTTSRNSYAWNAEHCLTLIISLDLLSKDQGPALTTGSSSKFAFQVQAKFDRKKWISSPKMSILRTVMAFIESCKAWIEVGFEFDFHGVLFTFLKAFCGLHQIHLIF